MQEPRTPVLDGLVDFILGLELPSLPPAVIEAAGRSITDWVGTAIRGSKEPLAEAIGAVIAMSGGEPQATVLGRRVRTSALLASMANGAQSHALDFDDTHLPSVVHGSAPVAPVVLALGEWQHVSGSDALAAFIAGFEVETRIGRVIGARLTERGWHATATLGHFGAAAAAGKLLHLNARQLAHALGIAGTQATGLLASFGTMSKPLHPGKAAMNGLLAALLAREGFTGSMAMLDGPGSLSETYLGTGDLSAAVEDFGKRWQLLDNSTKFYAACHLTHATVDAARAIRARSPLGADAIECVECRVHPLVMKVANQRGPKTDLEAKFSISFCAAIALLRGDAGEAEFNAAAIHDPDVARVMARVAAQADPSMTMGAAHMRVRLRDGGVLEHHVSAARGTAENPPSRDDVEEKFRRLATVALPAEQASRLVATLRRLVDLPDVGAIAMMAAG
jgi:2-methylcitrate dehydratase PrpD